EDQTSNFGMYYNPRDGQLFDDRFFSPYLAHTPPEFNYQAYNESDGLWELQYGTNDTYISDLNSNLNWDQLPCQESSSHQQSFPLFNVNDNGSGSNSVAGPNMTWNHKKGLTGTRRTIEDKSNARYCSKENLFVKD
ncbi:NAC domain-containing protein, partial [Trifolium medium]|nr:NAC domain-containing protein [Trifolium medium]